MLREMKRVRRRENHTSTKGEEEKRDERRETREERKEKGK